MSYSKILITGATGFIGSRLCEKFALHYRLPYRALVRNFSHAARIARLNSEMVPGALTDPASLEVALKDCNAVVHLAFAEDRKGDRTLLEACQRAQVKRFVHISSMAVHGPSPGPECAREETATIGHYNERYSDGKARSEGIVQQAIAGGLPGVVLRPTVVFGPHSPFVTRIMQDARSGTISLINQGAGVCNAVYVDDVCDAICVALHSDNALGRTFFVNADQAVTWHEFNTTFANMVTPAPAVRNFTAQDVRQYWAAQKPSIRTNVAAAKRLIASSSFHDQIATVPVLGSAITWAKANLKKVLSANQVAALKSSDREIPRNSQEAPWPDRGRLVREDFALHFHNGLAREVLGWKPAFDFQAGAGMTRSWLEFAGMLRSAAD